MMLAFRPITLADRPLLERYTMCSELQNCDLAFANIFCWRDRYHSEVAEFEEHLIIRFAIDGERKLGYMFPLGGPLTQGLIEALRADAALQGQPLRLMGLSEEDCAQLTSLAPEAFAFDRARSLSDYIYRRSDLERLTGKHYQPKRNHINRFKTLYPDYRFEALRAEHIEECLRLEQAWCQHTERCREAAIVAERKAMHTAFAHYDELGLVGGVLYVDDRLVAFSYGSRVNHNTFVVHVEKADTDYEGAFAMINRQLVELLDGEIQWINREEDLGIEGLRKAKLSYHPDHLVDKRSALWLTDEQRGCRELWHEAFPEDEPRLVDRFLMRYFRRERLFLKREGTQMVAMAHLVPFASDAGMVGYLYAVATTTDKRGRGLASELIEEAAVEAHRAGCCALVLIPADEALHSYYAKRGFEGDFPLELQTADHYDFGTGDPTTDRAMWRSLDGSTPAPDATLTCRYIG